MNMRLNLNPFNRSNPMTWKDAAAISIISASATYTITFLVNVTYGQVIADPGVFMFDSVKVWLQAFFGNFLTLAGLEQLLKHREPSRHE